MAKYRCRNKYKFATAMLCAFAFVMCFALTSAWGRSHNDRTHNQIAEAANADENSDALTGWELRSYPRTANFVTNLTNKYYGKKGETRKEFKATTQNLVTSAEEGSQRVTKFGKDASGNQYIHLETFNDIKTSTGYKGTATDNKGLYITVDKSQLPHKNNVISFSQDEFTEITPTDISDPNATHLASFYFNNAGQISGNNVDMVFRINTIKVKASPPKSTAKEERKETGKYGKSATYPANVNLLIGTIKKQTIYDEYIAAGDTLPQIAGSISLTSDNLVWSYGKTSSLSTCESDDLQVEIDYTIAIVSQDGDIPVAYPYPVYTLYSDLDVRGNLVSESDEIDSSTGKLRIITDSSGNDITCMFSESITPYQNVYPYAYRFTPNTASTGYEPSPCYLEMSEEETVKAGCPTFRITPVWGTSSKRASEYSNGFPASWLNAGVIITSDPTGSAVHGAYSAVWRGKNCETGISLSPCPDYSSYKSVVADTGHTLDANESYVEQYKSEEQTNTTNSSTTEDDASPAESGSTAVESTTTDANGYYTFNVDFGDQANEGTGHYGQDLFYQPDSVKFIDYLPAGLEVVDGLSEDNLQQAIKDGNIKLVQHYTDGTETTIPIETTTSGSYEITILPQYDESGKKVVSNKISVTVDQDFVNYYDSTKDPENATHFDGSTWRMVLKARPKAVDETTTGQAGYSSGKKVTHDGVDWWEYENKGAIDSEGYEFESDPVKVYTPLVGRNYTFYKLNEKGEATTEDVPDVVNATKPAVVSNTYKVKETVDIGKEGLLPTSTSVKDSDGNLWLFTNWKETSLKVSYTEKDKSPQDLTFIGYWKKIDKPTEIKEYNTGAGTGFITDNSAVQLNDNIAYELIATNNKYPTSAQVSFTDIPSVGLTFNPSSVVVKKELNGVTTTLNAGTDFVFTNNLTDNKGDGSSSLVWNFDAGHPVEYTAKIIITYYNTVNTQALTLDTVNNKCRITVGDSWTDYQLSNPVVKQITAKLDGKKEWKDQIPVSVGTDYYKVTVSKDTYSPDAGLDASAFVDTFNINPYSTGTTWDGSWTTGEVKFYLPGTYSFKVVEENTGKGGVTYSTTQYSVTYTVIKKTSASSVVYLEAEKEVKKDGAVTTDPIVFTNEYNPCVTVNGTIEKVVKSVGTVIPKNKTFYFKVSASPITGVRPIENTCSITTSETTKTEDTYTTQIGDFKFIRPGTYTITYEETSTSGDGWTTDNNKPTETITITDNGDGTMTANPASLGANISFTNTYDPTNTTFNMPVTKVTKADEGSYVPVKDQVWTFTLSAEGTTPLPAKTTTTITTNYGSQSVNGKFDPISYDQVGTYKYTITETKVDKWSVEPTSASIDLFVKVTDDAAGKLVVTGPYSDEACTKLVEYPTFTNTLTPTPVNSGIPVFKIMNCDLPTGFTEDFEAKISYGSECPDPQYTTCKASINTARTKTAFINDGFTQGFGEIEFATPGTYTYKVTETQGDNAGVTYDDSVYTITVEVAQDADDETSLKVTNYGITRDKSGETTTPTEILFENSYAADPTISLIDGEKWFFEKQDETVGVDFEDGDFIVKVTPDENNPEGCDFGRAEKQFDIVNLESAEAGKGKWTTGNITFSDVGTYQFRVSEVDSEVYGVEYSQDYYDVKFDVVDDTKGKLVVTKSVSLNGGSYSTEQTQVNFKNDLIPEPEKVYTNPTRTNKDTVLHIGDTVSYTLKWSNRENAEAEVIVRDIPSLGITFNNDAYDQNNKALVPTANNLVQNRGDGKSSIEWNLGKKPSGSYGTITYTITVNEQADMQLGVNNDYYLKVGNNPDMFVNRLSNPYEPPEYVESTNSSPTSDSAGVVALVAICLMCVTGLVCAIVRKNSKR